MPDQEQMQAEFAQLMEENPEKAEELLESLAQEYPEIQKLLEQYSDESPQGYADLEGMRSQVSGHYDDAASAIPPDGQEEWNACFEHFLSCFGKQEGPTEYDADQLVNHAIDATKIVFNG